MKESIICTECAGTGQKSNKFFDSCQKCYGSGIKTDFWSNETKTEDARRIAIEHGCCLCNRKPESANPLPDGFLWDTMEPDNGWVWCSESVDGDCSKYLIKNPHNH